MRTLEQILKECEEVQAILDSQPPHDEVELIVEKLNTLNSVISWTGALYAEAAKLKDDAVARYFMEEFSKIRQLSPQMAKDYVKARCAEENYAVTLTEKLHKSAEKQSMAMMTIVSYKKGEMSMQRNGY